MIRHRDIWDLKLENGSKWHTEKGGKLIVLGLRCKLVDVGRDMKEWEVVGVNFWRIGEQQGEEELAAENVVEWVKRGMIVEGW